MAAAHSRPDGFRMSDAAAISGGKGTARILAHVDLFDRLVIDEPIPAAVRLEQTLGPELAHTLVFALAGSRRRQLEAVAAA
jgi:hypothetical protein